MLDVGAGRGRCWSVGGARVGSHVVLLPAGRVGDDVAGTPARPRRGGRGGAEGPGQAGGGVERCSVTGPTLAAPAPTARGPRRPVPSEGLASLARVQSAAATAAQYLDALPEDRRPDVEAVLDVVRGAVRPGFEETMAFGMIGWVVPLSTYPDTYNGSPLSYVGLAAQKRHDALYLMGLYADPEAEQDFRARWTAGGRRLDMGRSCLRYRRRVRPRPGPRGRGGRPVRRRRVRRACTSAPAPAEPPRARRAASARSAARPGRPAPAAARARAARRRVSPQPAARSARGAQRERQHRRRPGEPQLARGHGEGPPGVHDVVDEQHRPAQARHLLGGRRPGRRGAPTPRRAGRRSCRPAPPEGPPWRSSSSPRSCSRPTSASRVAQRRRRAAAGPATARRPPRPAARPSPTRAAPASPHRTARR